MKRGDFEFRFRTVTWNRRKSRDPIRKFRFAREVSVEQSLFEVDV
jgi:hypothetical protein